MTAKSAFPLRPVDGTAPTMPWLWLGSWGLGGEGFGPQDGRESLRVLERAFAEGVRHFDSAGFYAHGRSEELLSRAFHRRRHEVFLSSKGGLEWSGRKVLHRASPSALRHNLEKSLTRLETDYLDLYQLHWPDPKVPIDESLGALQQLQAEGLIRHWGAGNLSANELKKYVQAGTRMPHQVHFNPVQDAATVLAAGNAEGRCINCAYSPLEQGLLCKVPDGGLLTLGRGDVRRRNRNFHDPAVLAWVSRLQELASVSVMPRVVLLLLWALGHADLHLVITGPRSVDQLREVLLHKEWMLRLGLMLPQSGVDEKIWNRIMAEVVGGAVWSHLQEGPSKEGERLKETG